MRRTMLTPLLAAAFLAFGVQANAAVINEFFADDAGGDNAEFIELFGSSGESLGGLSLIIVDGDTSGSTTSTNFRRVTQQFDFTSETIPSDGFYVLGSGTTPNVDQAISANALQNGSQTYALVRTQDIAFDATDTDELTQSSVDDITANLIDAVGYIDGSSDDIYFGAANISDGSGFAIDTAQRIPNGLDTDAASDWVTESTFPDSELADTNATPGTINQIIPEPASIVALLLGLAAAGMVRMRRILG